MWTIFVVLHLLWLLGMVSSYTRVATFIYSRWRLPCSDPASSKGDASG